MSMGDLGSAMKATAPYAVMTLVQLSLSIHLVILQSVLDPSLGANSIVIFVYEQLVSILLLCSLALLFDRGKRPKPSFQILGWSFFIGFLQLIKSSPPFLLDFYLILNFVKKKKNRGGGLSNFWLEFGRVPIGNLMFTASLRYITATFQSVAMNLIPVVVFVLAVACRRERFHFWDARGQAKLWGLLASASGATVVVVSSAREEDASSGDGGLFVGTLMVGVAVLAAATASLCVSFIGPPFLHSNKVFGRAQVDRELSTTGTIRRLS